MCLFRVGLRRTWLDLIADGVKEARSLTPSRDEGQAGARTITKW